MRADSLAARAGVALTCAALGAAAAPAARAEPAGAADAPAAAPARGQVRAGWRVFLDKQCVRCHAVWGHGGEIGPDLGRTRAGALTDADLAAAMWNHVPRMWGKMQEEGIERVPIADQEMADLFAYLGFVRALDPPGDPAEGERLVAAKRCDLCHTVGGREAGSAPDLRRWARYRNPAFWAHVMFEHAPTMIREMRALGVKPPVIEPDELVHIVAYVRSRSSTGEAELFDPGDPAIGRALFAERGCVRCHAVRGAGGSVGPDLGQRGWASSFTGVAIQMWNHADRMRTVMAQRGVPVPKLSPQEMAHVIAYLFSAIYSDPPADPAAGARVFEARGCALCHDGGVGPVLDKLRGHATPITLARSLWMHGPAMLEEMRHLDIRWPSLSGDDLRALAAYLDAPPPAPPAGGAAPSAPMPAPSAPAAAPR